ncbi:hypothetical protein ACUXEY_005635 [Bacillus sp. F9_6S_D1_P_5]
MLSLVGMSETKLNELGFLGFTISTVTSFLAIYVGYFWMTKSGLSSVELTSKGILVIVFVATIILALLLKLLERMDENEVKQ